MLRKALRQRKQTPPHDANTVMLSVILSIIFRHAQIFVLSLEGPISIFSLEYACGPEDVGELGSQLEVSLEL